MLVAERLATKSSVVLLCVFGLLSGTWGVRSDARPFTASDTINRERIGAVVASPNGDFLVFERESAYGSGSDFTFAMAGEPWGRSDLYIVSTLGGEPTPMRLLPVSDGRRLTLGGLLTSGSFSPDGRKITVYWPDGPSIHLGYYDFELNRLVEISNSPVVEPSRVQPVWLSATRLMYMAAASRTEHWAADRYRVAVSMASQWANARAGRSTALIFASGVAAEQFENHYGGNLFVYDTVEQQQRLLSPGRYSTISISPDGSSIAALHLIGRAALPPGGESDLEFDRGEIVLFGLDGRQHGIASCASCDVLHDSIAWSADSGRLAYFARPLGGTTSQGNYWLFDVKLKMQLSVDARAVKLERANFVSPAARAFPVARGIVFEGVGPCVPSTERARHLYYQEQRSDPHCMSPLPVGSNEILRVSRDSVDVFASEHVWRIFVVSKKKPIRLFQQSIKEPNLSNAFGIPVAGLSSTPLRPLSSFSAIDAVDGKSVVSMDLLRKTQKTTESPNKHAKLLGGSPVSGSYLYRVELEGVSHILLAEPNRPAMEVTVLNQSYSEIDLPIEQPLRYPSASGEPLTSCITTPRGPPLPQGFPTIVVLYPGHQADCAPASEPIDLDGVEQANESLYGTFMKSMAGQGFAVLKAGTPYSALPAKHGLEGLDDLLERALRAGAEKGLVDLNHVGLEGHSQGAVAGLWVLTHTKRFSAAVLASGLSDNISAFGALGAGVATLASRRNGLGFGTPHSYTRPDSRWYLGGAPWEVPDAYLEDNQILRSSHISTPLMLLNSDLDGFGVGQYEELYSALDAQRSEVMLVTYLGEGHIDASPANIMDAWTRQTDWFGKHLKAQPQKNQINSGQQH